MTCQRRVMVLSAPPRPEVQRSKVGSLETVGEEKQGLRFSLSLPFTHEEPDRSGKADKHPLAQQDQRRGGSHTWNKASGVPGFPFVMQP